MNFSVGSNFTAGNRQRPRVSARCVVAMPLSPNVVDFAQQAPLDQVDGVVIENAVVTLVTDRQRHTGLFGNASHQFALGDIVSHQFFAQDVLARLHCGDRHRSVQKQRRGNDDGINIRIFNRFTPIGVPLDLGSFFVVPAVNFFQTRPSFDRVARRPVSLHRSVEARRANVADRFNFDVLGTDRTHQHVTFVTGANH